MQQLIALVRAEAANDTKWQARLVPLRADHGGHTDHWDRRELLYRFSGETVPGEEECVPRDPRYVAGLRLRREVRGAFEKLSDRFGVRSILHSIGKK